MSTAVTADFTPASTITFERETVDRTSQADLVERCKALGWSLKYKFDGHALHSCFRGNDHQWVLFRNWETKTFKSLKDVAAWASAVSES